MFSPARLGLAGFESRSSKHEAEGLFQPLHPPGDSGLSNMQAQRRLAHRAVIDDRNEGPDIVNVHAFYS